MAANIDISNETQTVYLHSLLLQYMSAHGPGGSRGKALGCGMDGMGSIPSVGGVEIFLHSVSRLVPGSTQPPIK